MNNDEQGSPHPGTRGSAWCYDSEAVVMLQYFTATRGGVLTGRGRKYCKWQTSPGQWPLPAANDVNGMNQAGKIPEQCQEDIKPEVHADSHLQKDAQGRNNDR